MVDKVAKRIIMALVMLVSALTMCACKDNNPPVTPPAETGIIVKYGEEVINSDNNEIQIEYHKVDSWLENLKVLVAYDNEETSVLEQKTGDINGYVLVHNIPESITEGNIGDVYPVSVTYSTYTELFTISVIKKIETLSISALDKVYDGDPVEAVVTKINPNEAEIKWYNEQGTEIPSAPSAVGKYYVVVTTAETTTIHGATARLDFEISKAVPATPATLVIDSYTYSPTQKLSAINIGSEYSWKNGDIVPTCDVTSYTAIYNPNPYNYCDIEVLVTVNLQRATPNYILPEYSEIVYASSTWLGLSCGDLPAGFSWKDAGQNLIPGVNDYAIIFTPQDVVNYKPVEDKVSIWYKQRIAAPTISKIYSYTGLAQTVSFGGKSDMCELDTQNSALITQTNAGAYSMIFKILDTDKYCWHDDSSENKTITWTINEYTPGLEFTLNEGADSYSITAYRGSATEVVIPATYKASGDDQAYPVTRIASRAFNVSSNYRNTQKIHFLGSCDIDSLAFQNNTKITQVVTKDLNTWMGMSFYGAYANPMYNGADLYFGNEKVTSVVPINLKYYLFEGCTSLTRVDLSACANTYLTSIKEVFKNCVNLKEVVLPNKVFDPTMFVGTSLTSISLKDDSDVLLIKNNCVVEKSTGTIFFAIDGYNLNFAEATTLKLSALVNIPSLTTLQIPSNITSINISQASDIWNNLAVIKFCNIQQCFAVEGFSYFCDRSFMDLYIDGENVTSIDIPETITDLPSYVFWSYNIESVSLHDGIATVGEKSFGDLTNLYIEDLASWCGVTFSSSFTPLYYAENVYFGGDKITSLTIPTSVTEIKAYAFSGFTQISEVIIPNTLTKIGAGGFANCTSLTAVRVNDIRTWLNIQFGEPDKYNADVTSNPLYYANNLYVNGELFTELNTIGLSDITEIHTGAFYGYTKLTSVIIGSGVTRIGAEAFMYCTNVTQFVLVEYTNWYYYYSDVTIKYSLSVIPSENVAIFTTKTVTDAARHLDSEWVRK